MMGAYNPAEYRRNVINTHVDELDASIAHCLQVNGRASWSLIASLLAVPERTVSRRGQQLIEAGLVRIAAYLDEARLHRSRALLFRLDVAPGKARPVAAAIAARDEAYTVTAFPASNRVEGLLLPSSDDAVDEFAERVFPSLRDVRSSELTFMTSIFRRGHEWHGGALAPEVIERLGEDLTGGSASMPGPDTDLSETDRRIAALLVADGRSPVKQIAAEVGGTSQSVGRRMRALFQSGLLQMRTEVDPRVSGFELEAHVRVRVDAARVERLGARLAEDPAVMYCVGTTGRHPLEFIVKLARLEDLADWLTATFADFPGVDVVDLETEPRLVRRANITFNHWRE